MSLASDIALDVPAYLQRIDHKLAPQHYLQQTDSRNRLPRAAAADNANQTPDAEEGEVGCTDGYALDIALGSTRATPSNACHRIHPMERMERAPRSKLRQICGGRSSSGPRGSCRSPRSRSSSVSAATVHEAVNAGKLRSVLFGSVRRVRPEDLEAYEQSLQASRPPPDENWCTVAERRQSLLLLGRECLPCRRSAGRTSPITTCRSPALGTRNADPGRGRGRCPAWRAWPRAPRRARRTTRRMP
jgi:hypothetical protein